MTAIVTAALTLATFAAWIAADVWLYYRRDRQGNVGGYYATISYLALSSAQKRPIIAAAIALILGVILGHLWWPQDLVP